MPSRPTLLLIVSLPVGAVAYVLAAQVLEAVLPGQEILTLFVPLFVAGLAMLPFLIPFFDRKARQDLAEYALRQEAVPVAPNPPTDESNATGEPDEPGAARYDPSKHTTGGRSE